MDDSSQRFRPTQDEPSAASSETTASPCKWRHGAWCGLLLSAGGPDAAGAAGSLTIEHVLDHLWRTGLSLETLCCPEAAGRPCPRAPVYKVNSNTGELWACGRKLHTCGHQAKNLMMVLRAFQDQGWPHEIPDPLFHGPEGDYEQHPEDYEKHLHDAATALNKVQKPKLIHFSAKGRTIRWDFLPDEE